LPNASNKNKVTEEQADTAAKAERAKPATKAAAAKPAAAKKPAASKAAPAKSTASAAGTKKAAAAKTTVTEATAASETAPKSTKAKPATAKAPAAKASAARKPAAKSVEPKAAEPDKPSAPKKAAAKSPAAASATKPAATTETAPAKPKAAKAPAKAADKPTAQKAAKAPASRKPVAAKDDKPAAEPASAKLAPANADPRPWLKSYPQNVSADIGPLDDDSLGDLLVKACRGYASRPAFTCMGKSITFGELERLSAQFAAWLQSKGLEKGARVAIMMPNVLQYPVAMMAVLRAGYTVVNVNPLYTPRELEHQLKDSGAEAIVILENFANTLEAVIAKTPVKHVVVASMGDMLGVVKGSIVNLVVRRVRKMVPNWKLPGHVKFNDALKAGAGQTFRKAAVGPDDVAFLQYTGGTTGVSKGATLLHRNVLANVAQNALWVEALFAEKKRPEQLVYICALPLYHIFALTVNAMMGMQQGAHNVLIPNPRDIPGFAKELKKYEFHIFPGLNTLFNALLNNEDFRKLDFKPLMLTIGGGMAVQRAVADRWKDLTGSVICEGYGLSETAPVATANRFDGKEFTGTIGLPIPSTLIAIRDEDGKDLAIGEIGEICIKGPQVMAGYWNRPDETEKVMSPDGFFRSGDMGFMDETGYVKIVDRKKDMILVSGFNVYPNEIEDVVAQHPGVLEVAAVGVADEKSGEVPKLFVVRKDENLTGEEIIEFTKLPKTNVGKILRRELR
jgi:long-chain acyl-CoA synthetase